MDWEGNVWHKIKFVLILVAALTAYGCFAYFDSI
jgi:hypothetical protein